MGTSISCSVEVGGIEGVVGVAGALDAIGLGLGLGSAAEADKLAGTADMNKSPNESTNKFYINLLLDFALMNAESSNTVPRRPARSADLGIFQLSEE